MCIFPWIKISWYFCFTWDKRERINWFYSFSVIDYLSLIAKDFATHIISCSHVKEVVFLILTQLWGLFFMLPTGFTSFGGLVPYFFSLYQSPSSLCMVFDGISSNIHKVISVNPSANAIVFWDFHIHSKGRLAYSGGTDGPDEFCYNFFISSNLTQMVNFPTQFPDCHPHSPALLDLFISSDTSICSTVAFHPLGNSDHVIVSVSIDFLSNLKNMMPLFPFHCTACDYFRADWGSL